MAIFEILFGFALTLMAASWLSRFFQKLGMNAPSQPEHNVTPAQPDTTHRVSDETASVAFNEGKVQLYFYRSKDKCRLVFLPTAKFLVNKFGRRFEIAECRISDFENDAEIKAHARNEALTFIKNELDEKKVAKQSPEGESVQPTGPAKAESVANATAAVEPCTSFPAATKEEEGGYPYVIGVLNDFGSAPFPYGKSGKNTESYYVELKSKAKTFRMWGADLQRCVTESGVQVGKRVKIVKLGKQPVTVPTKNGQREVLKNLFAMTVLN